MIPVPMELLCVVSLLAPQVSTSKAPQLHAAQQILERCTELQEAFPAQITSFSIGTSRLGRDIRALRVGPPQGLPAAQPAILLVAGLDGARAYTSSMALEHAYQLAKQYGQTKPATLLLDTTTFYIIPRLDMDAGEARFRNPWGEQVGTGFGVDNDRDGRQGEDGSKDINGDQIIGAMRQRHQEGEWVQDPTDARVLIKADGNKGERGRWHLYAEGLDSDGDEAVAEDPQLDGVVNRNFPRNWVEHDAAAGRYPTHEPSALDLTKFMLDHKNIALVVTYGDEFNLGKAPMSQADSSSDRATIVTGVYKTDLGIYEELGKRYRKLTANEGEGPGEQPGSFQAFSYHHRGLLTLNIDPWSVPLDAKRAQDEGDAGSDANEQKSADSEEANSDSEKDKPKPSDDAKRLIWLDQNTTEAFLPWTSFNHPQLGAVELGGFRPYAKVEPPLDMLGEITEQHLTFLQSLGAYLPRLQLLETSAKHLGDGLVEIKAVLENGAFLPQQTHAAQRSRAIRPARVTLQLPDGVVLVAGRQQQLIRDLKGSGGRQDLRWLVAGASPGQALQILVNTDNAGIASANLEVK